jgi:hypothetical protein
LCIYTAIRGLGSKALHIIADVWAGGLRPGRVEAGRAGVKQNLFKKKAINEL